MPACEARRAPAVLRDSASCKRSAPGQGPSADHSLGNLNPTPPSIWVCPRPAPTAPKTYKFPANVPIGYITRVSVQVPAGQRLARLPMPGRPRECSTPRVPYQGPRRSQRAPAPANSSSHRNSMPTTRSSRSIPQPISVASHPKQPLAFQDMPHRAGPGALARCSNLISGLIYSGADASQWMDISTIVPANRAR
ncbi:uncharacterized protein CANTADRAFT_219230 [Suhomyces tanzawaensis NRRL Y-17324]|uniref:Uncharacterized protein n=1 Tax=Suhomyces tanzawaensis NRRL Y-17324 TaxID=984487 RepID=A0A1E4SK83_9ASCO|nr:uncharacterized protein CANTADRAFT_219230 [Suhomyces tanzawaensis NRRL Y-17324]ODV79913.1 hypothetical protein CANTADRAFT_219230 [Suhomyces tanzawaensis NRRL Y-17324]